MFMKTLIHWHTEKPTKIMIIDLLLFLLEMEIIVILTNVFFVLKPKTETDIHPSILKIIKY